MLFLLLGSPKRSWAGEWLGIIHWLCGAAEVLGGSGWSGDDWSNG